MIGLVKTNQLQVTHSIVTTSLDLYPFTLSEQSIAGRAFVNQIQTYVLCLTIARKEKIDTLLNVNGHNSQGAL